MFFQWKFKKTVHWFVSIGCGENRENIQICSTLSTRDGLWVDSKRLETCSNRLIFEKQLISCPKFLKSDEWLWRTRSLEIGKSEKFHDFQGI